MVQVDPQGPIYWVVFVLIPALGYFVFSQREAISKLIRSDVNKQVEKLTGEPAKTVLPPAPVGPAVQSGTWIGPDLTSLSLQTTLSQSDLISRLTQSLLYELPQIRQAQALQARIQEEQNRKIDKIYKHLGITDTSAA
jgi:hypothetical protein